jgi:hypothetical protein
MPNHSDILDASDLHYAKAKLFTGSPTEITPDFGGQILMDGLGRMFVAASKSIGDLVQVAGNGDGGSGNGEGGSIGITSFGRGRPQFTPETAGQQYFDIENFETYYAYHTNSRNGWFCSKTKSRVTITLENASSIPTADFQRLQILYGDVPDYTYIESGSYDFGGIIALDIDISGFVWGVDGYTIDLTPGLNLHGRGAYAINFVFSNPHQQDDLYMVGGTSLPIPAWIIRRNSPFDLLSIGEPIVRHYIFISELPETTVSAHMAIRDPIGL